MARFEKVDPGPEKPAGRRVRTIDPQVRAKSDDVARLSIARAEMGALWELPNALRGGTRSMREAGKQYLPQETAEKDPAYRNRLNRSFLMNAYRDTVDQTAGRPFTRDVAVSEDTSADLEPLAKDVDLQGRTLTQFASDLLTTGWHYGLAHFLVEFPTVQTENGEPPSRAQTQSMGLRPYFVEINPENILGWRSTRIDGVETLTQLRIRECTIEPDGEFGEAAVDRVRVYSRSELIAEGVAPVTWKLYRRAKENGPWQEENRGELTGIDQIPLVTFYVARTAFMTARPPLEDLAWINLAHWQSSSDQRNILRFARCATMFGAGIKADERGGSQPMGANIAIFAADPSAKLQMVEHSGAAIGAGQKDLEALEDQMVQLGLQPMLRRSGNPTATAVAIDTASSDSPLVASVRRLEQALESGFLLAGVWLELADAKVGIDIAEDFELSLEQSKDVENLLALRKNKDLSRETLYDELRRRRLLSESFDATQESERLRVERAAEPPPPTPGGMPGNAPDPKQTEMTQ